MRRSVRLRRFVRVSRPGRERAVRQDQCVGPSLVPQKASILQDAIEQER